MLCALGTSDNEPCVDVLKTLRRCNKFALMSTDPRALIQQLIGSGMNESQIVAAIKADGVDVSLPTINRIKNGLIKRTGFDIGSALVRLHKRRIRSAGRAA
jgi:hypothetical protein